MTVKCLNNETKKSIELDFTLGIYTIDQLAAQYGRSRRTIIRVLEERGIDPGIRRRPAPQPKIIRVEVPTPVIVTPDPWYRRMAKTIRQVFNPSSYADRPYQ